MLPQPTECARCHASSSPIGFVGPMFYHYQRDNERFVYEFTLNRHGSTDDTHYFAIT